MKIKLSVQLKWLVLSVFSMNGKSRESFSFTISVKPGGLDGFDAWLGKRGEGNMDRDGRVKLCDSGSQMVL